MLNLATNLFIAYLIYLLRTYIILMFNKKSRDNHRSVRGRLHELRSKSNLTIDEQKEFINLKNPKREPFNYTFKNVSKFIFKIGFMVFIFIMVRKFWMINIDFLFSLWQVIIIMVLLPIMINFVLKRFGLEQDDLTVYFRR